MSGPALLTLVEAATAIAAGTLSSQAATEACLARIEAWQPKVNAFIRIDRDRALAQARERDRERAQGRLRGPLHGVPLAHKDALYVRSHYDTVTVTFGDGPSPDEVLVIFAVATRGRPNARVGGLKASEIKGQDGLV